MVEVNGVIPAGLKNRSERVELFNTMSRLVGPTIQQNGRDVNKHGGMKMINVIASIRIKDGQLAQFIEIFKSNIPSVLSEKGCIEYLPTIDCPTTLPAQELDGKVVTILEKWVSIDDLNAHLSAPHMVEYRQKVKDLVENVSLKIVKEI